MWNTSQVSHPQCWWRFWRLVIWGLQLVLVILETQSILFHLFQFVAFVELSHAFISLQNFRLTLYHFAGLPNPRVVVTLGAQTVKTKTIPKTTNPAWKNEVHDICIKNWELPNLLTLRVISRSKGMRREIELGYVSQTQVPHIPQATILSPFFVMEK